MKLLLSILTLCNCCFDVLQLHTQLKGSNNRICFGSDVEDILFCLSENTIDLFLSDMKISSLSSEIVNKGPNIQNLHLEWNKIRNSVDLREISRLKCLAFVDLSNNNLEILDITYFSQNSHLKTIAANNNPGIAIYRNDAELSSLKEFYIGNCLLLEFSLEELTGFTGLEILDISFNNISSLPENMLQIFPNLTKMFIKGNPISTIDVTLCPIVDVHPNCVNLNESTTTAEDGITAAAKDNKLSTNTTKAVEQKIITSSTSTTESSEKSESKFEDHSENTTTTTTVEDSITTASKDSKLSTSTAKAVEQKIITSLTSSIESSETSRSKPEGHLENTTTTESPVHDEDHISDTTIMLLIVSPILLLSLIFLMKYFYGRFKNRADNNESEDENIPLR